MSILRSVELQKYVVFEPYGPISHMLLLFMLLAFVILSLHSSCFEMD